MELEQLKDLWPKDTGTRQKQDNYLLSLLSKRSNSPIAIMKRNLRWELIAVIILYTVTIVYYFFAFSRSMTEISWLMLGIGVLFLVYYYRKNKLLNDMQCVACQVKSNLEQQVGTLEKYVRFYLLAGNILYPLTMLVVGYIAIVLYPHRMHPSGPVYYSTSLIIKYLVLTAALSIGMYFANKWYVNRLYGQHIRKLKAMLNEMKE
ncbi:MAG TPA: hypothetical protein VD996_15425 [Chitinophagaceae bacterium]|nr:hypothetical protein [Chitinophagaceae bacterium]